ncbi:DNA polymerase III subunit beta [Brevundimonas sp. DC300-4]|uniref:DNA polymerase III subunit beta n=1 Tax=Brevundimonas sp. DC300-4 TaxID=2804594 RepID=UPI003CEF42DF
MKIFAEQAGLARVTARIANVAERKATIPILNNMLIDAQSEAGAVWFHGTDLDMEIRERLEARIETPGQITLPASSLAEIARGAPAGAEVMIGTMDDDPRAAVKFGRSRYLLPILPAGDFPTRSTLTGDTLTMPAADLLSLLDHVHFAQSTEETRYYLCGTHLTTVSDEGRPVFRVVATDGNRMVLDQRPIDAGVSIPGVIVPRAAIAEFRRILAGSKADVQITVTAAGVALELDDVRLTTKTIDGAYPDYLRVLPRQWDREITIDRAVLHSAIKRVAVISADKSRSTKLSIEDEVLTLTVRNMEAGMADEQIEVQGEGLLFETGFNAKFLLDVLEQTDADQMILRVTDGVSPARLDPHPGTAGAANIVNVIMPLRV